MKRFLLLALLALATTTGFSQTLGIKGGPTYYTFSGSGAGDYEYRIGYTAGIMLQQHINELIGLQVEALYTSKGGKVDYRSGNQEIKGAQRLNYVDVPVLLHLSASGLFIDLGPQVSFITKARSVREVTSAPPPPQAKPTLPTSLTPLTSVM